MGWLQAGPAWVDATERKYWQETVGDVVANLHRYFPDDQEAYLSRAGGDPAFSLWLRLADEQLAELPDRRRARPGFPWRAAYDAGWPPREAACTAWSGLGERPDILQAVCVRTPTPESIAWGGVDE